MRMHLKIPAVNFDLLFVRIIDGVRSKGHVYDFIEAP